MDFEFTLLRFVCCRLTKVFEWFVEHARLFKNIMIDLFEEKKMSYLNLKVEFIQMNKLHI